MPSRNITIDTVAYTLLKQHKLGKESFSDVIKRLFPKPADVDAMMRHIRKHPIGEDVLAVVEKQVNNRGRRRLRAKVA